MNNNQIKDLLGNSSNKAVFKRIVYIPNKVLQGIKGWNKVSDK